MRVVGGRIIDQFSVHHDGPWPCEQCKQLSQFAEVRPERTKVYCRNERCRFTRIIDKRNCTIVENDGSIWQYDPVTSAKWRIR